MLPDIDQNEFFELFFSPEVPFLYKVLFVGFCGIYFLSPIDILPEAFLGVLGYADDVGIIYMASQIFTWASKKYLEEEAEQQVNDQMPPQEYARHNARVYESQTAATRVNVENEDAETLPLISPNSEEINDDGNQPVIQAPQPPPNSSQPAQAQQQPPPPAQAQQQGNYTVKAPPADVKTDNPPTPHPSTPVVPAEGIDYLHDEWHERLIADKRKRTDDEFDRYMKEKEERQRREDDWDFDRNNPFQKPRK